MPANYYYYDTFYFFIFVFILIFLLFLIFLPSFKKIDIVPPLSDSTYKIVNVGTVNTSTRNLDLITFDNLTIEDGVSGGTEAINFGTSGGDTITVGFAPNYEEAFKRLVGYFSVDVTAKDTVEFLFRVIDANNYSSSSTLSAYNEGWAAIAYPKSYSGLSANPIRTCRVPFNIPKGDNPHLLQLQTALKQFPTGSTVIATIDPQLRSAYLYYTAI